MTATAINLLLLLNFFIIQYRICHSSTLVVLVEVDDWENTVHVLLGVIQLRSAVISVYVQYFLLLAAVPLLF